MVESYSTEPVEIGTWIDGKTLYRRVFRFNGTVPAFNSSVNSASLVNIVSPSQLGTVSQVTRLYGYVINYEGNTITFPNLLLSAYHKPSAGITVQSELSVATSRGLIMVVEYTV